MTKHDNVPIRVFGSRPETASYDSQDEPRVATIVREQVLDRSDAEYFRVDIKIRRKQDATPDHLVAYLLRKDIYLAEVVRVDLAPDYSVRSVTYDYEGDDDEDDDGAPPGEELNEEPGVDGEADTDAADVLDLDDDAFAIDFVAATPADDIATAKAAVKGIHKLAKSSGLNSVMLLGESASIANYKKYLSAGLKGFVNVGHGNPNGIVLDDGFLSASWFQGLSSSALRPEVVYFNSCQVFNNPLQPAIIGAGARSFIGGKVNLLIGPSEKVCSCFWKRALTTDGRMDAALTTCEKKRYPNEGAHGFAGDGGPFGLMRYRLAHAMWTHGSGARIEHPERLSFERPYGALTRIRGKPFTGNWVHFQIPTPVIVDKQRLRADSAMIRFKTGPGAYVHAVHIWDGDRRIATHNGLHLEANNMTWQRFGIPGRPPVRWGLGVSVGVKFGDDANLPSQGLTVDLAAAGCDFVERA